jgi:hypothetical protein
LMRFRQLVFVVLYAPVVDAGKEPTREEWLGLVWRWSPCLELSVLLKSVGEFVFVWDWRFWNELVLVREIDCG